MTDQALAHIGAQFYPGTAASKAAPVAKASRFQTKTAMPEGTSSRSTMLEKYLHNADRMEIFSLGLHSPRSSRYFDGRLILLIDGNLVHFEAMDLEGTAYGILPAR